MTNSPIATLLMRIEEYKRKYYLNRLIKGSIFSAAVILSAFLVFNTLEYFGHFGTTFRTILFFSFLGAFLTSIIFWVVKPLMFLYGEQKPLSNELAADQIGKFFPEVGDKLVNTLQLTKTLDKNQNELLLASIKQKSEQLGYLKFADAIKINENRKYLKFAALPAGAIALILMLYPAFFSKSTERIVNFKNEYQEEAPFSFVLENKKMQAFKNEDFTVNLSLQGNTIPESVYLIHNDRKLKMESSDKRHYTYTFSKVQQSFDFKFEAAGFKSGEYDVEIVNRPSLAFFDVNLTYPSYLNKPNESMKNVGNLTVPEGTHIEWDFNVTDTDSILMVFEGDGKRYYAEKKLLGGGFDLSKRVKVSGTYKVYLKNQYASNAEGVSFFLNVVPDKYPQLSLEQYKDSTLYNFMVLGGNIADDYGISKLAIFYKVLRDGKPSTQNYASLNLPINANQTIQSFYKQWNLDSLKLSPADKLEYFIQVWDNDGVNGAKSTRSQVMNYAVPDKRSIDKEIDNSIDKTEAQLEKTLDKAQKLRKEIAALENRLKNKKELDFQDKKLAEELIKKKEELMNEIKNLQEQNQNLNEKQQRFNEQKPENQQKMEALQKMMNELMDPETQKMYEELKKMLEQNPEDNKMLEQMERLKNKERNAEKELERMKDLFKKLQLDQKMDKAVKDLENQAEKEEKLAEKNEELEKKADNSPEKQKETDAAKKEQEKLSKEFEDIKKDLKEAEKMNEEMKNSDKMDMDKEQQEDISDDQKDSEKQMDKGDNKSAAEKQKRAAKKMRNLAQKLAQAKQQQEMKQNEENMDDLRDILDNLVTLSFDQEKLMKDFRGINPSDPRFVKLSQDQLKLQDDAKVIEDSLYTLSKRVLQIETFVTREMNNMKGYMGDAVRLIKERKLSMTTAKQQFAMTSMNNLALLLSDVLKQMQQNQQMMMQGSGSGKGKSKGKQKSMGETQKELNQQMQQSMQKGSKGQGGVSEQLAKMAREQSQLRKMLQQFLDSSKGTEKGRKLGDEIKDMMKKMEETETDLVNKRLDQNLIKRQQELLTRLLESEKAMKEQEEDQKRKAETARQNFERKAPPQFQQYVKDKQKQTELLRTVPPNLNPYYKRQVDNYFKQIN
ncbi:hypothetical protein LV89_04290 [Arcicella aurantiaca]|uniref:ATPase n=1 Tax=Arcicella aurantiaca TaxID=591202 RepID=A0A316DM84_9BACT|nr:DUF4175 family protein [Arcicella aurantiaca]PWK17843.1 hypothetical protein LV89_04290 [Arcicella aurantiaca]